MGINFSFNSRRRTEAETPEAARAARVSVNGEPEDEPLEDLSPAGSAAQQPGPAARPWGGWRTGVLMTAGRRLAAAAPPPRGISRGLRLAVLFGNNFVLMSLFVLALVFVPSLDKLHGIVGGLREGLTDLSAAWLVLPGAFLFAVAVSAFTGWWAFRFGQMQLDRLVNWRLCHARLKSKVKITCGDSEVYRMRFEYEAGGQKYTNISDMNFTSAMEDETEEPVLYDPLKPRRSMLVDELPASIILDERGGFTSRWPFMGYFYASLPLLLLAAMGIAAFR
ncbi:MAG TPA: hypothetical protein DEQ38_06395 [Elusimicrobia bacterium]|nr:MAG: hypothetical protein A2089_08860 [Elusimicrobia bacterium GWD2_63_28]HCC47731.1 hypothetical protein [Elusimicrobiota bacterium]